MSSEDSDSRKLRNTPKGGAPAPLRWLDRLPKWHSRSPSRRTRRRNQEPVGPFHSVAEFSDAFADELARALGSPGPSSKTSDETGIRIAVDSNTVFLPQSEVQQMWDDILIEHDDGSRGTTWGTWTDSILGVTTEIELEWDNGTTDLIYDDS